jgi:excisionase family DNA binding protein
MRCVSDCCGMTIEPEMEPFVTIKPVAAHLGVKPYTLRRWIKSHDMPCYRIGRGILFKMSEVDTWAKQFKRSLGQ